MHAVLKLYHIVVKSEPFAKLSNNSTSHVTQHFDAHVIGSLYIFQKGITGTFHDTDHACQPFDSTEWRRGDSTGQVLVGVLTTGKHT